MSKNKKSKTCSQHQQNKRLTIDNQELDCCDSIHTTTCKQKVIEELIKKNNLLSREIEQFKVQCICITIYIEKRMN